MHSSTSSCESRPTRHRLGIALTGLAIVAVALSNPDATHAAPAVRIEVEFYENAAKDPTSRASVFISDRRLRIEQRPAGAAEDAPVFVYRGDRNRLYSIVDAERTYFEIEPRLLVSMGGARTTRRELRSGLDPIPADQQRFFGHLMGVSQIDASRAGQALVVRRTGGVGRFAGFACREVELGYVDRLLAQGCVADWQAVGLAAEDVEVFRSLAALVAGAAGPGRALPIEMVPGQPLDLVVQLGGFPLYFERAGQSAEASAIRVASVERVDLAEDWFDVPEGYAARTGVAGLFRFASLLSARRGGASAAGAPTVTTGPAGAMPASLAPDADEQGDFRPRRARSRHAPAAIDSPPRVVAFEATREPESLRYRPIRLFEDAE